MKKFVADTSFWELFDGASFGVVVARGMKPTADVAPEDAAAIEQLLARANAQAERHLGATIAVKELVTSENREVVIAEWRPTATNPAYRPPLARSRPRIDTWKAPFPPYLK